VYIYGLQREGAEGRESTFTGFRGKRKLNKTIR
jgi:hypothetical protein